MNVVTQIATNFNASTGVALEQVLPVAIMILLWGAFEIIAYTDNSMRQ